MFWRWNVIKFCVWTCVMTSRSYFGKMNSTLGSVVPLAMFGLNTIRKVLWPNDQLVCLDVFHEVSTHWHTFFAVLVCNRGTGWNLCSIFFLIDVSFIRYRIQIWALDSHGNLSTGFRQILSVLAITRYYHNESTASRLSGIYILPRWYKNQLVTPLLAPLIWVIL